MRIINFIDRLFNRRKIPAPKTKPVFVDGIPLGINQPTQQTINADMLRQFSKHPIPRRAINVIKNGLKRYYFQFDGPDAKLARQILRKPDPTLLSWSVFQEKLIEDMLVVSAGAYERRYYTQDGKRGVVFYVRDASTVQVYADWLPGTEKPRFAIRGHEGKLYNFRDKDLAYIPINSTTYSNFGLSPMEFCYIHVSYLRRSELNANISADPTSPRRAILTKGNSDADTISKGIIQKKGTGEVPVISGVDGASTVDIGGTEDKHLFLQWQERLTALVANAFELPKTALNETQDSNRSTAESDERQISDTVAVYAKLIEEVMQDEMDRLGLDVDVAYKRPLTIEEKKVLSQTHVRYMMNPTMTVDEIR
ncbi:MAG TPA: hypothetical protein GX521_10010, partial [Firmicutes bacterium]|nr:hypothetical protein [Bacillota bacterium]